ncbi:MAG: hypothetical protein EKK29_20085 [Hyphomicrobiales bacterium]|nr:MAG: hypothetical protein EKK29_20085 [Hyphomicrobiales bacterium]
MQHHEYAQLLRVAPLFIQFARLLIRIHADLYAKLRNPAQIPPIARVCTPFSLAFPRVLGLCTQLHEIPLDPCASSHRAALRLSPFYNILRTWTSRIIKSA